MKKRLKLFCSCFVMLLVLASCMIDSDAVNRFYFNNDVISLNCGDIQKIEVTWDSPYGNNKTLVWSSTDDKVVSVLDGYITAKKVGTAVIIAKSSTGFSAACTVNVLPVKETSIVLTADEFVLVPGHTARIGIKTWSPENVTDKKIAWSSENTEIATVDDSGNITAVKIGTTRILATSANGIKAYCNVSVVAQEDLANRYKPVVFYHRQPVDPYTGKIYTDVMNWSDKTFFVGFDYAGGGDVQGKLITDYLVTADPAKLDRNGDGIIGYVLCIGNDRHPDSRNRTEGIRKALGTWNGSTEPAVSKEGSFVVGGKSMKVVELEAREMMDEAGFGWNMEIAKETMDEWATRFSDQIDMVVSNNDGMAMWCLQASNYPVGVPIFGYDANPDAVEAVGTGVLTGTVTQNANAQAASTLQVLRNLFDGLSGDDVWTKGITMPDTYGNMISAPSIYDETEKAVKIVNSGVNSSNWEQYVYGKRDPGIKQISGPEMNVLLTVYNNGDNFYSSTYIPALKYYAPLLNINLTIVQGDGQNESKLLDSFTNLSDYDAYAINMIRLDSGMSYLDKLEK